MNSILFNIMVIGILFFVGWIAIFSNREKIKLIQGIILLFLSVVSYLLMIGVQKKNSEMIYIGYLALGLINIFVVILAKLIQDCFNQDQEKEDG
ncbi:MAG: hypothetical protein A2381_08900 [Bdellovibrionales bacterium RIFOXYB1_FULL_37_110]|nr:MAG: hypothetical protein A2181_09095 [Bdellovibrionales bacterium RIFOXYA1_FULL_38_20]OFZ50346.1 MAG: hypothetical protein A2417_09000 [Bdellovibrionales bacterium RIFOXYC1_FULL_37_79]OFZ60955.1 MAG: hypothetical protein A2381_08900 [Bdellovibrionales bacterium RIFOXYB1_FULL_37_110]OFZ63699.1 MAG: hypothetical protein A2577_08020 [Bdellovibrionales bacterium RIFOXYD1_FULL_36_51]